MIGSGARHTLLAPLVAAILLSLAGCGGASGTIDAAADGAGGGGAAEGGAAEGGATGGSGGGAGQHDAAADGTASSPDATDSTDAACDTGKLWNAVSDATLGVARLGYCAPTTIGTSTSGEIVLDGEGRVIDNTGTNYQTTSSKQAWLDSLANDRWPCLAGQTIPYQCIAD